MSATEIEAEAARCARICAACLYCDGLCPVFPALAEMRAFDANELGYLANLCHNCRACWYACQYAPPHPFAVNLPATLAALRRQSYAEHIRPRWLAGAFRRPALGAALIVVAAGIAMLSLMSVSVFPVSPDARSFYAVAPWAMMTALAGGSALWAALGLIAATRRFWRTIGADVDWRSAWRPALGDIVTLRHLGGGGEGCNDADIRFSQQRRWFHHLMAAGFVVDFLASLAAAVLQHMTGVDPPYPLFSLPVGLGVIGGAVSLVGVFGLIALEARADPAPSDRGETWLNLVFLTTLGLILISGLALLALRSSPIMPALLIFHLSLVVGFFVALPASKALHAPFRAAALLRAAAERRRSSRRARRGGGD